MSEPYESVRALSKRRPTHNAVVVGLLATGISIAYLDRTNISVVLASTDFRSAFSLSDSARGLVNSAFFWSYAALQFPAGILVDRYSVRNIYTVAFVAWSLLATGTAWVTTVTQLIAIRVLLGVAESVVTPASLRWISDHIREERRGIAIGTFQSGTKIGSAIATPISVWFLQQFGWRGMFTVMGLGCLFWLLPWVLLVNDGRGIRPHGVEATRGYAGMFRNRITWGILLGTFCYSYFAYFCVTWLPAYFVERRGLSLEAMGLYSFLSFAGIAIMTPVAGWIADRMIARGGDPIRIRKAFIIAGFLLASTELIGAHSNSRTVALFFAVFSLTALGLASANYWAISQSLVPYDQIGRIAALQNFASNLSGLVSPLIAGWLIQATRTYESAMEAIWVVLIWGVFAYSFLIPHSEAAVLEQRR